MKLNPDDKKITVCSSCLKASCWQGIFFCQHYLEAGTVEMTVGELKKLGREHPSYWKDDR